MFQRFHYEPVATLDDLTVWFLSETAAAASGYGERWEALEALHGYFMALKPYAVPEDFGKGELPVPEPLEWLTTGIELHCFFRSWLRKRGRDPETGDKTERVA